MITTAWTIHAINAPGIGAGSSIGLCEKDRGRSDGRGSETVIDNHFINNRCRGLPRHFSTDSQHSIGLITIFSKHITAYMDRARSVAIGKVPPSNAVRLYTFPASHREGCQSSISNTLPMKASQSVPNKLDRITSHILVPLKVRDNLLY